MKAVVNRLFKWKAKTYLYSLSGTVVIGSLLVFFSKERLKCALNRSILPPRSSQPYICGRNYSQLTSDNYYYFHKGFFYLSLLYRSLLLFMRVIPIIWLAILTYKFGVCSEDYFCKELLFFFTAMGPTYIKLGQWMATRSDIFPPNLCKSLENLYDSVEEHHWKHTEKILKNSYVARCQKKVDLANSTKDGKKAVFDFLIEIQKKPIKSGSIAQIHIAKLKEDIDNIPCGTELAIKVVHPNIRQTFAVDFTAMRFFFRVLDTLCPDSRLFNLDVGLREFEALVMSQLDLRTECDNLLQFAYNFRNFSGVVFPTPLPSLVTKDLLVETFEDGEPLTNLKSSDDNKDLADVGCHMLMKMLFEDNFVHSDLHPGNVLVRVKHGSPSLNLSTSNVGTKQTKNRELVVLDAGLVTTLSERNRFNFISLFSAVACGEGEYGANLMLEGAFSEKNSPFSGSSINATKFRMDMKKVFDQVSSHSSGFNLSSVQIGKILLDVLSTLRENKVPLDGSFSSLILTVIVGEGLGRKLAPHYNLFAEASPYLISYLKNTELYCLSTKLEEKYGTECLLSSSIPILCWYRVKMLLRDSFERLKIYCECLLNKN